MTATFTPELVPVSDRANDLAALFAGIRALVRIAEEGQCAVTYDDGSPVDGADAWAAAAAVLLREAAEVTECDAENADDRRLARRLHALEAKVATVDPEVVRVDRLHVDQPADRRAEIAATLDRLLELLAY